VSDAFSTRTGTGADRAISGRVDSSLTSSDFRFGSRFEDSAASSLSSFDRCCRLFRFFVGTDGGRGITGGEHTAENQRDQATITQAA
jgi:hypothetical protein